VIETRTSCTVPDVTPASVAVHRPTTPPLVSRAGDPCVMVIFGASGDLTKRLLMPALYNLACDGLFPKDSAIIGMSLDPFDSDGFRAKMSTDVRKFSTRGEFNDAVWTDFVSRLHYMTGKFDDPRAFESLRGLVEKLDAEHHANGNILFYMAVPPFLFGLISEQLGRAGFKEGRGWRRLIVEKPFGSDLASAIALNKEILSHWSEEQIFRIDHYLGKETVQNLLAFRFSNGMFEPLWNRTHVDHIQFTVAETVGVEGRGGYYDKAGVLRDMIQNHMFQMLAYLCMEPPTSFKPDAIRNEKSKLLDAVRIMKPGAEVLANSVRGQYGAGKKPDGSAAVGYREETGVATASSTETFAAVKLHIDNWRWEGVPIYLRSGKALWKRGTEILVQFKRAPEIIFRDLAGRPPRLDANQLIFHIQPDQGIELRFHAKTPGPTLQLQKVNMRFDYRDAFEASRGTGYEVLIYSSMIGDATLFSRTDLVETAWRIAQPILDTWASEPGREFPNYPAGTWGPRAAFDLIEDDGRRWLEVINRDVLEKVPLFAGASAVFLQSVALVLKPDTYEPGSNVVTLGDAGNEMYFIARGETEVLGPDGAVMAKLGTGDFFGEASLLLSQPRNATVRAKTACDVYVLEKADFLRVLKDHPRIARSILEIAKTRYSLEPTAAYESLSRYLGRDTSSSGHAG
jgi:glucose-6-phosphate 1-dehydrogenase